MLRRLSLSFSAGVAAALLASVCFWALGHFGVTARLQVALAPALSPHWLYPRLVIGGLWGLLLLLPLARNPLLRGLVIALPPAAVQLLWIFPFQSGQGWGGLELGLLTPAVILVVQLVWGWTAVLWARATGL